MKRVDLIVESYIDIEGKSYLAQLFSDCQNIVLGFVNNPNILLFCDISLS
jgi:hypothetical protein